MEKTVKASTPHTDRAVKGNITILLVGSEDAFAGNVTEFLTTSRDAFAGIAEASSLQDAIELLKSAEPDVVILSEEFSALDCRSFALDAQRIGFKALVLHVPQVHATGLNPQRYERTFEVGDFRIDVARRRAWIRGVETKLRINEFDFLRFLCEHPQELLSREAILELHWGTREISSDRLRLMVHTLRNKIEESGEPRYIINVRGLGYRFVPSPSPPLSYTKGNSDVRAEAPA
jgi:DNA-binding winged helix-turn-helix (wHTH) protein